MSVGAEVETSKLVPPDVTFQTRGSVYISEGSGPLIEQVTTVTELIVNETVERLNVDANRINIVQERSMVVIELDNRVFVQITIIFEPVRGEMPYYGFIHFSKQRPKGLAERLESSAEGYRTREEALQGLTQMALNHLDEKGGSTRGSTKHWSISESQDQT